MKMKSAFVVAASFAAVLQINAADITGTVTLKGTPPPEIPNNDIKNDATCGKFYTETPTTHHWVVSSKGELANVTVMLKGVSGKSTGASAAPLVIDQKNCQYSPQIFAVQTGQTITVKNSDPVLHNIHTTPATAGNDEQNKAQMPGGADLSFAFAKEEKFLKFKCDVHPWMFAWVTVVDSPYFAVTDKDGKFTIKNVPPGKYTVTALHRKAAPTGVDQAVEVKDSGATADFALEVPAAK